MSAISIVRASRFQNCTKCARSYALILVSNLSNVENESPTPKESRACDPSTMVEEHTGIRARTPSPFALYRYPKVLKLDPGAGTAAICASRTGTGTIGVKISVPVPVR